MATNEIRCINSTCNKWFRSPINFSLASFDETSMSGNKAQCPHCGKTTPFNKENMRVKGDEGGFLGKDT